MNDIPLMFGFLALALAAIVVLSVRLRRDYVSDVEWLNDGEDDRRQRLKELGE